MFLCALEALADGGRLTLGYIVRLGARFAAVVAIAWLTAIALWPWLQIGNPLQQFKVALVHFATMPMALNFLVGRTNLDRRTCRDPTFRASSWPGAGGVSVPASGCSR